MPYFFASENLVLGKESNVEGKEALHILLSHRCRVGELIKLQDETQKRFLCEVVAVNKNTLNVLPKQLVKIPSELKIQLDLFVSLVSEKSLDIIFQKATEFGAAKIVLFNSQRTATKFSLDNFKKKSERWEKILFESAKQSERSVWPSLEFVSDFDQLLKQLSNYSQVFLADQAGAVVETLVPLQAVALCVGPEGGFSETELNKLHQFSQLQSVKLSPFVLRTESAVIGLLSNLAAKVL